MKTYSMGCGIEIRSGKSICGTLRAMGECHIIEETTFSVFKDGVHVADAETWDQAKAQVFSIKIARNQ